MPSVAKFVTESKYLNAKKAGELNGKTMIIESVFPEVINEKEKLCVRFKDCNQILALNQTNITILATELGDDYSSWANNKVVIHIVRVSYQGQMVPSIQLEVKK